VELSIPSLSTVKNTCHTIFDYKIHFFQVIHLNPFEGIISSSFLFLSFVYAKIFLDTFRESSLKVMSSLVLVDRQWDKNRNRMMSAINLVGAVSRFFDWGSDRGWFALKSTRALFLKTIGGFTGTINYAHRCIRSLEQLKEVERLGEIARVQRICQKEIFDAKWYAVFAGFSSNFLFMVYSGTQVINVALGVLVASEVTSMLFLAGMVMFCISFVFHLFDHSALWLDHVRLLDPNRGSLGAFQYSYVAR